jgi:hypothetical protein
MKKWLLMIFLTLCVGLSRAESLISMSSGSGHPGSHANVISISLVNQDPVKSMQLWIADIPNMLKPDSVWLTKRCSGFDVFYNDVDGMLNIIMISTSQYITPDTGAVLQISYSVGPAEETLNRLELQFYKPPKLVGQNYAVLPVQVMNSQFTITGASAVERTLGTPENFALEQNYPNPFNPTTQIPFRIAVPGAVELVVYDMLGRRVRTLVQGHYTTGVYRITWDGRDDSGQAVAGGMYLCQLISGRQSQTRQMIFLK